MRNPGIGVDYYLYLCRIYNLVLFHQMVETEMEVMGARRIG